MSTEAILHNIDAYLVDLDGTLYDSRPIKALMAAELLLCGPANIRILHEFRRQHEQLRHTLTEPAPNPLMLQMAKTAEARGEPLLHIEQVVQRWMIERPCKWLRWCARRPLLTELARFRAVGGKLALVSDYPAQHKLRAFARWVEFDSVVANGEANGPGRLKPFPDGYLKAAKALDVAPERCLVIGDREDTDGAAAQAAGMRFRRVG